MKTSIFSLLALLAFAAPATEQESVRRAVEDGRLLPLSEIVEKVQARHPGRILEVELERGRDGRRVYEIEVLLTQGRRIEVQVDAATGQFLDDAPQGADIKQAPMDRLLESALQQWPGHVVEVELEHGEYAVEILRADGSQVRLMLDPVSGQAQLDAGRSRMLDSLLPMQDVLAQVQREFPGTLLDAELDRDDNGRWIYEIELLTPRGRILELTIDATTGAVLDKDYD